MKYLDGIFNIVVGGILLMFPPVSNIDLMAVYRVVVGYSAGSAELGNNTYITQHGEFTVYQHSIPFMIIGFLFVAMGIYKIWKEKQDAKED